jgi:hypothetical protein
MKSCATTTIVLFMLFGSTAFATADPNVVLRYITFLGPREDDISYMKYVGIGVDMAGCACVSTSMPVAGFPTTPDARQQRLSQTALTKLSADGSWLIYSSFFGAPPGRHTVTSDMAIDQEGNAYLVGINTDDNFPATPGSFHPEPIGPYPRKYPHDGFLVKFDPTLKNIIYGTFLGNNEWDEVIAVALDPAGCACATGDVGGRPGVAGRRVYRISPDGSGALYEEGVSGGYPYDIAVDAQGYAYVAGNAGTTLMTTPDAYKRSVVRKGDFVRKLAPSGNVVYSTYIRRIYKNLDADTAIAVDIDGSVLLCRSTEYPQEYATEGAYDTTHNGDNDVYIFKLDPTGSQAVWATYLGGEASDRVKDVAIDALGNVYVTGRTKSSDFPTTQTALDTGNHGDHDVFVSVLDASGGKLLYSTVLGGGDFDTGQDLVLDLDNNLYVAGTTRSVDFPTTVGAFQQAYSGLGRGRYGGDVFVVKLDMGAMVRTVTGLSTDEEHTGVQPAIDDATRAIAWNPDPGATAKRSGSTTSASTAGR